MAGFVTTRQHPRRGLLVLAVLVLAAVLVFAPPARLLSRSEWRVQFGTFSATAAPPRVNLCDRRFYPDGLRYSLANARADADGPLTVVARTPAGTPILAYLSPRGSICTMTLYAESAPGRYVVYVLSGGP
jgi:hypothetical protein